VKHLKGGGEAGVSLSNYRLKGVDIGEQDTCKGYRTSGKGYKAVKLLAKVEKLDVSEG
jgi:hypothetical protein